MAVKSRPRSRARVQARPEWAGPGAFMHATTGGRFSARAAHLALLDRLFVETAYTPRARLVVSIRPRVGKSQLITVNGTAWYLGMFPNRRVMVTSNEARLATDFGGQARDLLTDHGAAVFGERLRFDTRAKSEWAISGRRGGLLAAGIGGNITGRGADLLVIEDPVKNAAQALNPDFHAAQMDWLRSTALSRLEPNGSAILVMARWAEDDLAGRVVRELGWPEVRIPTIALEGEPDPLGRQPGEHLWPERFTAEDVATTRRELGAHWFEAQHQQRPVRLEGSIFRREWLRFFRREGTTATVPPREPGGLPATYDLRRLVTWQWVDVAASTKRAADYTVVLTGAVTPRRELLILDVARVKMEGPDQPGLLRAQYQQHRPSRIRVERQSFGLVLIQALQREGLPVSELSADADKVSRALVGATFLQAGQILVPDDSPPWLADFLLELLRFSATGSGGHDDQVDVLSYAARDLATIPVGPARTGVPRGRLPGAGAR